MIYTIFNRIKWVLILYENGNKVGARPALSNTVVINHLYLFKFKIIRIAY